MEEIHTRFPDVGCDASRSPRAAHVPPDSLRSGESDIGAAPYPLEAGIDAVEPRREAQQRIGRKPPGIAFEHKTGVVAKPGEV